MKCQTIKHIKMYLEEANREIAKFLGWEEQTDPTERFFGCWFDENGIRQTQGSKVILSFHSGWDALMPVIQKICSLGFYNRDRFTMTFVFGGSSGFFQAEGYNKVFKFGSMYNHRYIDTLAKKGVEFDDTKLMNCFFTVVDAIKEINSGKWYGEKYCKTKK